MPVGSQESSPQALACGNPKNCHECDKPANADTNQERTFELREWGDARQSLHIGRMDLVMCRLTTELLRQAKLSKGLARRARNDALQRSGARVRSRALRHAIELEELATQLIGYATSVARKKLIPNAVATLFRSIFGLGCELSSRFDIGWNAGNARTLPRLNRRLRVCEQLPRLGRRDLDARPTNGRPRTTMTI